MKKTDEARFSQKNLVLPKIAQTCQKKPPNEVFSTFLENSSNDFSENMPDCNTHHYLTARENRMSKKNLVLEI